MPVPGRFAGCHRTSGAAGAPPDIGCGPPVAAGAPPDVGCRAATGLVSLDAGCFCAAGAVLVLVGQNLYMWLDNLHS